MTNVHEQAELCRALDTRAREIMEAPSARDTFRASLGGDFHSLQVGWPVLTPRPALRASDVLIELTRGTASAFELALVLDATSAAAWVDRALGGNGESGIASSSGSLSEAECGVLAYLAARICKRLGAMQVCDVRTRATLDACVLWPITLDGRVLAQCALAPWLADGLVGLHRLRVSVFDRGPSTVQVGEVWISDRWNLSSASDGLAGEVLLRVEGCAQGLSAIVSGGRVQATGPSTLADQLELVLGSEPKSFGELARIAGGEPFTHAPWREAELRKGDEVIARGELVSWRGAIGLRVTEA
jgi:hypothetical protein